MVLLPETVWISLAPQRKGSITSEIIFQLVHRSVPRQGDCENSASKAEGSGTMISPVAELKGQRQMKDLQSVREGLLVDLREHRKDQHEAWQVLGLHLPQKVMANLRSKVGMMDQCSGRLEGQEYSAGHFASQQIIVAGPAFLGLQPYCGDFSARFVSSRQCSA